jgi:hypothetical protein
VAEAGLPQLLRLVVEAGLREAELPLLAPGLVAWETRLPGRQSYSAVTGRTSLSPEQPTYERAASSR